MLSLPTICMLYLAKAILAQQENVIYVLPEDQPLTHCPEEENCYRMTELVNHDLLSGQISNTTIALLPGTHTCTSAVNKTLSISNATNFALIAANSSAGATVKCNGNIGFEFNFITNLTITGIVFTECGSYQTCNLGTQSITFTLFLNYSTNANISNVIITDGNGIGLILMNPQGQTTLTHSCISHNNYGNIYVFSIDNKHIALSDTIIAIVSSNFTDSANPTRVGYDSCIPILTERPFGVQFIFQHSRYHIHVKLINISLIQNDVNIYLKYTSFKTTVKIKGLKSVGKRSLSKFKSVVSRKLLSSKLEDVIMIENSYFIGGKITFYGKNKTVTIMNRIFLSNVCFESSQKRIFLKSQNITLRNITILATLNGILFHDNSVVIIEGTLSFLRNKGEFMIQEQTNVTVNKNSNLIFRHNRVNDGESPFISTNSNIKFLANSLALFENNTGSQSYNSFSNMQMPKF